MSRKGSIKNISIDDLKSVCANKYSYASVLEHFGLSPGGNVAILKRRIESENINVDHFTGQGWSSGKTSAIDQRINTNNIDEVLSKGSFFSNGTVRKKFLSTVDKYCCSSCDISSWMNKNIILEVDHIDGDSANNAIENLRLLCPNCHSQTPTYKKKNITRPKINNNELAKIIPECYTLDELLKRCGLSYRGRYSALIYKICLEYNVRFKSSSIKNVIKNICLNCSVPISYGAKLCRPCDQASRKQKIKWPPKEELEKLIWSIPTTQLAINLGVADTTISNRCKKLGIIKPSAAYWIKQKYKNK